MVTKDDLKRGRTFAIKLGGLVLLYGIFDAWTALWLIPRLIDLHDSSALVMAVLFTGVTLIVNAWAVTIIWGMFLPKNQKD